MENKKTKTESDRVNLSGNAISDNLKNVRISPFKAYYYTENDGKNPGAQSQRYHDTAPFNQE